VCLRFKCSSTVAAQTFPAPILIERAGPSTRKKFFEFFTVPIRNANTRAAYYRAIQQFLAWAERAGYQDLEDIEPITVAAYLETLQRRAAPPTVKQHMTTKDAHLTPIVTDSRVGFFEECECSFCHDDSSQSYPESWLWQTRINGSFRRCN
jgi:hypothetical protein